MSVVAKNMDNYVEWHLKQNLISQVISLLFVYYVN